MQQVAFITGVSSGIGYATAAGAYRSRRPADLAGAIDLQQMDVNDDKSVERTVSAILADAGRIDVLINNAGYALVGAPEETSLVEARDQFDTNFFGTLRVTQQIL